MKVYRRMYVAVKWCKKQSVVEVRIEVFSHYELAKRFTGDDVGWTIVERVIDPENYSTI